MTDSQSLCNELVSGNVHANVTMLVQDLLHAYPDDTDYSRLVSNVNWQETARDYLNSCDHDYLVDTLIEMGGLNEHSREDINGFGCEQLRDQIDGALDEYEDFCLDEGVEADGDGILEHWIVSDFLAERLRQHGETVVSVGFCHIWGRSASGQAIAMDGVIQNIVRELELYRP